jgi:hypothetical protein
MKFIRIAVFVLIAMSGGTAPAKDASRVTATYLDDGWRKLTIAVRRSNAPNLSWEQVDAVPTSEMLPEEMARWSELSRRRHGLSTEEEQSASSTGSSAPGSISRGERLPTLEEFRARLEQAFVLMSRKSDGALTPFEIGEWEEKDGAMEAHMGGLVFVSFAREGARIYE